MDSTNNTQLKNGMFFLIGVISLAFILRLWGISYGMPYSFKLDETFLVNRSLAFGTGDLNPHLFEWPGTLLMYALFFIFGFYFLFGKVSGIFASADDFAIAFIDDPTSFYIIARVFMVIISTATVYGTYYIGKKMFNRNTGLLAALFMAVAPLVSGVAHFTLTDTPLTLMAVLSLIPIYQIAHVGKPKYYILAGVLIGLGMAIKYNAAALIIPLVTAHILNVIRNNGGVVKIVYNKYVLLVIASLALGFIIGCPFCVLDFSTFYKDITFQFSRVHEKGNINAEYPSPFLYYINVALFKGAGVLVTILSIAGLIYAIYRKRQDSIILISYIVLYFLYISRWKVAIDKYLLPVVPVIIIFGALFLVKLYEKYFASFRYGRIIFAFVVAAIVAIPLKDSMLTDHKLTQKDTRSIAKEWIESNIPGGMKIAIDAGRIDIAKFSPPINDIPENRYDTYVAGGKDKDNKYFDAEKDVLNKYHELRLKVPSKINYSLTRIVLSSYGKIDRDISLEEFKKNRIEYVVVSSYSYEGYASASYKQNHPEAAEYYSKFYQSINDECELIKEFPAEPRKRPGPTVKIYKIDYKDIKIW